METQVTNSNQNNGGDNMIIKIKQPEFSQLRIRSGHSQNSLSLAIGKSISYITRIENLQRNPSPDSAQKICEVLNCEFDDIFFIEFGSNSNQNQQKDKISV